MGLPSCRTAIHKLSASKEDKVEFFRFCQYLCDSHNTMAKPIYALENIKFDNATQDDIDKIKDDLFNKTKGLTRDEFNTNVAEMLPKMYKTKRSFATLFYNRGNSNNETTKEAAKLKAAGLFPLHPSHADMSIGIFETITNPIHTSKINSQNTSNNYEEKEQELKEFKEKFVSELEDKEILAFDSWYKYMSSLQSFNDSSFLKTWNSRWRNNFISGKTPRWSFPDEAISYFDEILWKNKNVIKILLIEKILMNKLSLAKKYSQIKLKNAYSSPIFPQVGDNMEPFTMRQDGRNIKILVKLNSFSKKQLEFTILPWKDSKEWKLETVIHPKGERYVLFGRERIRGSQSISYKIHSRSGNGDLHIFDVKQPTIRYSRNKSKFDFDNGNFDIFIDLIREVDTAKAEKLTYMSAFFKTSLHESTAKTLPRLEDCRMAFVDIGIKPMATISYYEFNKGKKGDIEVINDSNVVGYADKFHDEVIGDRVYKHEKFIKHVRDLDKRISEEIKPCINFYKDIRKIIVSGKSVSVHIDRDKISNISKIPFQLLKDNDILTFPNIDYNSISENIEESIDFLKTLSDTDILLIKSKVITLMTKAMRGNDEKSYSYLATLKNKFNLNVSSGYYDWLFLNHNILRLKKSLTYLDAPPMTKDFKYNDKSFCKISKYIRNMVKDCMNKTIRAIVNAVRSQNCDVLVLEELSKFKMSKDKDSSLNRLLALWKHRTFTKRLEEVACEYGIAVCDIDARHSSQLNPENMSWGCRGTLINGHKSDLFVENDGVYSKIDSDLSATNVLATRFFSRYKDIVYMKCRLTKNGDLLVPESKYIASYLLSKLGKNFVTIKGSIKNTAVIRNGKLIGLSKKEYDSLIPLKENVEVYNHYDNWLNRDEHKSTQINLGLSARAELASQKRASLATVMA